MSVRVKRGAGVKGAPADAGASDFKFTPDKSGNGPQRVNDTVSPSETIVKAGSQLRELRTPEGNKLVLRRLTAIDEMRLSRALGADSANPVYVQWCLMAACIYSYNDDIIPMPVEPSEFEFIIQRIGTDGVLAIQIQNENARQTAMDEMKKVAANDRKKRAMAEQRSVR